MTQTWRYRLAGLWLNLYNLGSRWTPAPPGAFRILILHDTPPAHFGALRRLLDYLLEEHGLLTPAEAAARLAGRDRGSGCGQVPYLLTFDDGFAANRLAAAEILDPVGIKAVFFLCPGLMDFPPERQPEAIARHICRGALTAGELSPDLRLMTWEDAASLQAAGHTIGSHTLSHRCLAGLDEETRTREILAAARLLEQRLGSPVPWFSYPFGEVDHIDAASLAAVAREHRFCASGIRGLNSAGTHPLGLFREEIKLDAPFVYQQLVLRGGLDFLYTWKRRRLGRMLREAGG